MARRLDPATSSTSSEPHPKAVDLRPRPHGQHRLLPPPASRPDSLRSPPSLPSLPTKRNRVDAPGPPPRDTLLEEGEVKEEEDVDERPEGMGTEIKHEGERDDGGRRLSYVPETPQSEYRWRSRTGTPLKVEEEEDVKPLVRQQPTDRARLLHHSLQPESSNSSLLPSSFYADQADVKPAFSPISSNSHARLNVSYT